MNFSFTYLSLKNLWDNSNYLTLNRFSFINIAKSNIEFSFHGFISANRFSKITISTSKFKNFLDTAIKSDSNDYTNQTFTKRLEVQGSSALIQDCKFENIKITQNGAALSTNVPTNITNCIFSLNFAMNGGAIWSTNSLSILKTSFTSCSSHMNGGAIHQAENINSTTEMNFTSIDKSESNKFAAFYRWSYSWCYLDSLNITQTLATNSVGAFEAAALKFEMKRCIIKKSQAMLYNGAVLVRGPNRCMINNNIFISAKHNTDTYGAASAIFLADAPIPCIVLMSIFIDCSYPPGFIISAGQNGKLSVINCTFSAPKSCIFIFKKVVVVSCKFNQHIINPTFMSYDQLEIQKDQNANKISSDLINNIIISLWISTAATIALYILQTIVLRIVRGHKKLL